MPRKKLEEIDIDEKGIIRSIDGKVLEAEPRGEPFRFEIDAEVSVYMVEVEFQKELLKYHKYVIPRGADAFVLSKSIPKDPPGTKVSPKWYAAVQAYKILKKQ